MINYNEIHLVGRAGNDPEIRHVGDVPVYCFSLAVDRTAGVKATGKTDWFQIQAWNKPWVQKAVSKGDTVLVVGRMEIDKKEEKVYTNVRALVVQVEKKKQKEEQEKFIDDLLDESTLDDTSKGDEAPF